MLTATYKMLKNCKHKWQMEEWLTQFGFANYVDGIKDDRAAKYGICNWYGFTD